MNYLGTEHLIVYAFLLVSLLLGLWAGRDIKNIRDYAIANKMYGTGVLTITFLATYLGGGNTIIQQRSMLSYGLVSSFTVVGTAIMFVCIGIFVVPKMTRFNTSITVGDLMKELYGPYGGMITGGVGTVYTIGLVGVQLLTMGSICERFLNWPTSWSIGLGGLILILYSSFGGIKAVTITDVFQFIVFVMIIPLIANLAVSEAGGVKALFAQVPADKLTIYSHEKFPKYSLTFLFWALFPIGFSAPPIIQRILMARNKEQARHMLFTSAAFILVIRVLLILTCLSVLVLAPDIKPSEGGAYAYIIQRYFSPILKGLSMAGILAITMSTLDSFLNAGGLLFTHNVLKPILENAGIAFDELKNVRYVTFLMGCASVLAALSNLEQVRMLSLFVTSVFAPVITFPLIAGILGLKPDTKAFLVASTATVITSILAKLYLPVNSNYLVLPISIGINAVTFLGMHVVRYGSIVVVQQRGEKKYQSYRYGYETKQLVFALFICFNYMIPYFMYTRVAETTMFGIKLVGILLCVGLLLKPYWPARFKKYFDTYWHFCLLYCLPFTTTVLYLLNGGGLEWTINVALSIMFLLTLVDWRRYIIISLIGIGLGILYVMPTSLSYENAHALAYAATFSTLVGLLFARRKEQQITWEHSLLKSQGEAYQAGFLQAATEQQATFKALRHTGAGKLLTITRKMQHMHVAKEDQEEMEALQRDLIPIAFQLQGIDTRSQDYLRLHIKEDWHIEELLNAVKERMRAGGIQASVKIANEAQHQTVTGDFEQLAGLLTKSIALLQGAFKEDEEEPIILMSLKDTQLTYPLPDVAKNYIKHVPALRIAMTTTEQLPVPVPSYSPDLNGSTNRMSSETTQELDKAANARIVKAHYGYAEVTDNTILYVIPTDVREVRPRDMDKAYMEVDATPKRSNDHYKSDTVDAQIQEAAFLTDVAAKSNANLGLVKMALELIKWYHGPSERKSGEPFYLHPLTVAHIVLSYDQDEATIIGALLHDTVEDTPMLLQHIETVFGKKTAEVVDLVTHLQSIKGSIYKIKMSASENLQMLDQAGNKRGLFVKLADRMHNMRTIKGHKKIAKRQLIARETMDFFVPLAKKLGLKEAAQEFEKMCAEVFKQKD